ncbi:MAG: DUF4010 domain-containing protein [Rhizobiales bacterium]|nr:DUF4010 domain-containing protein [Hyphomicrobiales bacterium]
MHTEELLSRFAVALGIGLLIGLERGWRARDEKPGSRTAGFRTFAISALLGGVVGMLALAVGGATSAGSGVLIGVAFAAFATVITVFCLEENRADNIYSATTAIAAILTFALGIYAVIGEMGIAAAVAVAAAGLLALRESLHGWVKSLTWPELRSGLVLLTMTFIALPVVPNDPVGPFGGVNPREIWLIAIVLAGVSFLGYAAVKYFGERHGVLLAAAAGGLVSSTAVTLANARRAAAGEGVPQLLAAGVALAMAVSFGRVLAIVTVLRPSLLVLLAPPLLAATIVALGLAFFRVYWRADKDGIQAAVKLRNPFGFWSVIGLALSMGVIVLTGRFLNEFFGSSGAIVGAATLGLFDVDAVTVSMTRLVPQPLSPRDGTFAILAAVASNTLSKLVIGAGLGPGRFARDLVLMSAAATVAGLAGLWSALLVAPAG